MADSGFVGELDTDEEALEASERIDSSLIFVWSGCKTLMHRSVPPAEFPKISCLGRGLAMMESEDLE